MTARLARVSARVVSLAMLAMLAPSSAAQQSAPGHLSPTRITPQPPPPGPALVQQEIGKARDPDRFPTPTNVAPYRVLDNIRGSWINLNAAPVRPMAYTDDFASLYAVNTHDSTVVHFADYSGTAAQTFPVPWSPVSIALWVDPDVSALNHPERILVVCRGTYGLAILERATGDLVEFLRLPTEPGDLIVDDVNDRAFVACGGDDSVVQIDLIDMDVERRYAVRSKHPLFLSFDGTDVLVAPMISGNNTVVHKLGLGQNRAASTLGMLDLTDPALIGDPADALPDEDLFRIDPDAWTITPIASGVGTILFAHGVNPVTGVLWQLNTEANNRDVNGGGEPEIRGAISQNRVTLLDLQSGLKTFVDLDQKLADQVTIDVTRTIGQPYNLTFVRPGEVGEGFAYLVGLLTDNVTAVNRQGQFVLNWGLPDGAIPRAVLIDYVGAVVAVYCWGTGEVRLYTFDAAASFVETLDLGHDPAPPNVVEGRRLFYDGSHSKSNNASCATCHVDGRHDGLAWDLSNRPKDDKGPMVTQTLAASGRVKTFHWRGEQLRGLVDFNGAFDALLGGTELDEPSGEFQLFEDFVFSIDSPANPNQSPDRLLNNDFSPPVPAGVNAGAGDMVRGQRIWFDHVTVGGSLSCNDCHALPTGTDNDIFQDSGGDPLPERQRFMVTGFNEMWRKDVEEVEVTFLNPLPGNNSATQTYPLIGAGFAHAGTVNSLFNFSDIILNDQDVADVHAFMHVTDSGMAPAAHSGAHFDQATFSSAGRHIQTHLLVQADRGHADLAVFGTVDLGGSRRALRWAYDRDAGLFVPEDSSVGPRPWSFFVQQTSVGLASNVFFGLPLGMAERFALDYDDDGLFNGDEVALGTDPYGVDSDGDTFWDGHEVAHGADPTDDQDVPDDTTDPTVELFSLDWVGTRQAKLTVFTDELTRYSLALVDPFGSKQTWSSPEFATVHTAMLSELLPSSLGPSGAVDLPMDYSGTVTVTDLAGNTTDAGMPPLRTLAFPERMPGSTAVLGALDWGVMAIDTGLGSISAFATSDVYFKVGGPPAVPQEDVVLVARVLVLRAGERVPTVSPDFTTPGPTTFTLGPMMTPPPMAGPFLLSTASDASGRVTFDFAQGGLATGDTVILNIEAGAPEPPGYDPDDPGTIPNFANLRRWSFADTPKAFREISIALP